MSTRKQSIVHWVRKTWPILFWAQCEKCGLEFRREFGWRGLPRFAEYWVRTVCSRCFPTRDEAIAFIGKMPPRPPAPPAPPRPRSAA
jgi:hypothetical protein